MCRWTDRPVRRLVRASTVYAEVRELPVGRGELLVGIEPAGVAGAASVADRGQWRLSGDGAWRDGGSSAELEAGVYLLEFKGGVSGFAAPVSREVIVWPGERQEVSGVYLFEPSVAGSSPEELPLRGGAGSASVGELPYALCGQVVTAGG